VEYILLSINSPVELEREVNEKLKKGWELYGNPFVAFTTAEWYHYQAMIKTN